jgi:dihydropteroate synthase
MTTPSLTGLVRVFACTDADQLADELCALPRDSATSTAQGLRQAAVKIWAHPEWSEALQQTVACFAGLALIRAAGERQPERFLLVGQVRDLEACAIALNHPDNPAALLSSEILTQLRRIPPFSPGRLACGGRYLDFSEKTGIMGILNVTPDSFSDGGRYVDPLAALDRAHQMADEGADIIDIGGQSTRPGAEPVPEEEERRRVLPVIERVAQSVPTLLSVDTCRAEIARAALDAGAHLINDISALSFDPALLGVVARYQVPLIVMHMRGTPRDMHLNPRYDALIDEVFAFLQRRLHLAEAGGVRPEHLLIDPGIGFGKAAPHCLEILRKLHHFHALGRPIVIGTSRKSFIGWVLATPVHERLEGTAATVAYAIAQGAAIVRVHDVKPMARVARMMDAIVRPAFTRQEGRRDARVS